MYEEFFVKETNASIEAKSKAIVNKSTVKRTSQRLASAGPMRRTRKQ